MQHLVAEWEAGKVFLQKSVQPWDEIGADGGIPMGGQTSGGKAPPPWSGRGTSPDPRSALTNTSANSSGAMPSRASDVLHVSPPKMYFLPPSFLFGEQETSQYT